MPDNQARADADQAPRTDRPDLSGRELLTLLAKASVLLFPVATFFMAFMAAARTLVAQHQLNDTGLSSGLVAIFSAILFIFYAHFAYQKIFRSGLNVS